MVKAGTSGQLRWRAGDPGFSHNLIAHWEAFVCPSRRLLTLLPFLQAQLPIDSYLHVVDLAAGVGCDAVALAKLGYSVVANEIQPEFLEASRVRAKAEGVRLDCRTADWRVISAALGTKCMDAAILLGNSFCLLLDREDRKQAAVSIAALLRPGGRLIVDERNFRYMQRERSTILRGEFRYSRRVMFCGEEVQGVPVSIVSRHVRFEYRDSEGHCFGALRMWPFRERELVETFEQEGLRLVNSFADLGGGTGETADFFTHVLDKP